MTKIAASEKVYFPNLNGLRAIGAFIVMIGHVEFLKVLWGLPVTQWFPIAGKSGVALFFSLSGFLIASLLFNELGKTHTIRLKDFYIRRILRIWPLYYLSVLLGMFLINRIPFLTIPVLSERMYQNMNFISILNVMLIIPNFTHFYIPYVDQRWSIIIEEQFYLVQPAIMRIFRKKHTLIFIFCLITFSSEIVHFLINVLSLHRFISDNVIESTTGQLKYLGCIAVGCLFSTLFYKRESLLKGILFTKGVQLAVLLILLICSLGSFYIMHNEEFVDLRLYSLLFSIVVINGAQNPRTIYNLEFPVLNFLGKISYGIYMYHMICIGIAFAIARSITGDSIFQNVILYSLSIGLTIFISWLSFTYFESFFLKLSPRLQSLIRRKIEQ